MTGERRHQRGTALLLVVVSIALVGGMVSTLALYSARAWERSETERLRMVTRAMADSAGQYVRRYLPAWRTSIPSEPICLDPRGILPQGVDGSILLVFDSSDGGKYVCRVSVATRKGKLEAAEEFLQTIPAN